MDIDPFFLNKMILCYNRQDKNDGIGFSDKHQCTPYDTYIGFYIHSSYRSYHDIGLKGMQFASVHMAYSHCVLRHQIQV